MPWTVASAMVVWSGSTVIRPMHFHAPPSAGEMWMLSSFGFWVCSRKKVALIIMYSSSASLVL